MESKMFEVRDTGTFIPALAIKLSPSNEAERFLLARAGYGRDAETQGTYIMLAEVEAGDGRITSDCYKWDGNRTLHFAHMYIIEHFDSLEDGAVVDVEYILKKTNQPKISESLRGT